MATNTTTVTETTTYEYGMTGTSYQYLKKKVKTLKTITESSGGTPPGRGQYYSGGIYVGDVPGQPTIVTNLDKGDAS